MTSGAPLYLVTACTTPQEFVAAFRRYTDRSGLFVPSAAPLPAGKRGRIAIALRDGGVMIEGEAEVVASTNKPSALYGRTGMTIRFVEPDDASKALLAELDRARIALKAVAPSVAPRPSEVAAEPRPVAPPPGGRIDAANALAETVTIGDLAKLRDVPVTLSPSTIPPPLGGAPRSRNTSAPPPVGPPLGPPKAQKFVMPSIPAKAPTIPPPFGEARTGTPIAVPKIDPALLEPVRPRPIDLAPPPPPLAGEGPAMIVSRAPVDTVVEAPPAMSRTSTLKSASPRPASAAQTQPTAVVPPPPRAPTVPPARPKPIFAVVVPDETTDLTEVPDRDRRDGVPIPAPDETRKTSLGISAVLVAPAPPIELRVPDREGPADTELMSAERDGVVGPAQVVIDRPGLVDVDMLAAAAAAELSGDWTMTPDADAPVPLVVPAPPAPPAPMPTPAGPLTGDWIISTDAGAVDGWSAPSAVTKRQLTNPGVGPPMLEVASDVPLSSEPRREPAREDDGPKVQIDPTLIEALPDLDRLAASTSPSPTPLAFEPTPMLPIGMLQAPGDPPPPPVATLPGMQPAPPGWMQPGGTVAAARVPTPLPGALQMHMPQMPPMSQLSMPAMGAMPAPTPLPGFLPPVSSRSADPTQLVRPTEDDLAIGDTTAMVKRKRRQIIAVVALVLLAIAGGVYLIVTTGGSRRGGGGSPAVEPPAPSGGSDVTALAAAPTADAAVAPAPDAAPVVVDAAAAPAPVIAVAPTPGAASCKVKVISFPGAADILVDSAVVGHTPADLELPCGVETKLALRKAGYVGQTRSVTPKAGATSTVRVGLPKPTFSLKVSSTPAGAAITINGKASGVTPSTVKLNAFEAATIVMTKAGFDSYSEKITPKANAETVHGTLRRKPR